MMITTKQQTSLLLALFLLLYLVPLGFRPLIIPDETRYAEIPREMISSGDWVAPRLNGLPYFEKPVLGYWVNALSLLVFGQNNFAVRFPSALACGLGALIIFCISRFACGAGSRVPFLSVLIYLTALGVVGVGRFAVLDSVLTFFLTATLAIFFLASEAPRGSARERLFLLLAGLFAGGAFLTKGFLAFAVPVLTVAPYLLWQGRWKDCWRMVWLPIVGAIIVSLPWALWVHQRAPDFWSFFFWNEHVRRFFAESAQHKESFWFYFGVLPAMIIPWIFITPSAVLGLRARQWQNGAEKRLWYFLLCWLIFPFLFFSVSKGKLIGYILPCIPPLAILVGMGFDTIIDRNPRHALRTGIIFAAGLMGSVMVALIALQLFGPPHLHPYTRAWKWILLVNALIVMVLFLIAAIRSQSVSKKLILFGLAPLLLFIVSEFTLPAETLKRKAPGPLLQRHAARVNDATVIVSSERVIRAVCWYFKRSNVFLVERAGELQYGIDQVNAHRLLSVEEAGQLLRANTGNAILVADHEEFGRWRPLLPRPVAVDSTGSQGYLILHF